MIAAAFLRNAQFGRLSDLLLLFGGGDSQNFVDAIYVSKSLI